jgi:phosphoserine phosphatase RsbU/P
MTIGDVAGRGIRAASVMGRIRPALRAYVLDGRRPAEAVERLDRLIKEGEGQEMTTLFHLHFDPRTATAEYVRAGHPPALLRCPDGTVVELDGGGTPPLGVLDRIEYRTHSVDVPPGSLLLLYTDGLIERRDVDLTRGLARLKDVLARSPVQPDECLQFLAGEFSSDAIPDDVAMLAMTTRGA